jgi:hypothetical protein
LKTGIVLADIVNNVYKLKTNHLKHKLFKQTKTMKKQVKKITLKTDKIVNLSKSQSRQVAAGRGSDITGFWYCVITTTKTI